MGEAEELTPTDSLILAVGDTRDVPRLLAVIDSVEQRGELTLAKSIFFRTGRRSETTRSWTPLFRGSS